MFGKVLIANRGEIAVRVARTCREMGVATVAVYSDVDATARHTQACDEAVHLPGVAAAETYLNVDAIVQAARRTGAQAIHPGYGFLSEQAPAARAVGEAGLVWIGPSPEAVAAVGDKVLARRLAESAGVPVVPGTLEPVREAEEVRAFGERYGYPIAIKASAGGGGRGFRVVDSPEEVEAALDSAAREAEAYFGSGDVYLERYLSRPKHVEIQILGLAPGRTVWLGARDCSVQRRHQKLIEETPPPTAGGSVPAMGQAACRVADACGYTNAGTVEFLFDEDGSFYFLEVNARLQVEHTITEEVLGLDLVACQLKVAAGEPVDVPDPLVATRGHAIECRINAEDAARDFAPTPGTLREYREPSGPGVRVDSGFGPGDTIPDAYDDLIAKLVVWGSGREQARRRMLRALHEYRIDGVSTTIPAYLILLEDPVFVDGSYTTRLIPDGALAGLVPTTAREKGEAETVLMVGQERVRLWNPAMAASASAGTARAAGGGEVLAPMHGTILKLLVAEGDEVAAGDPIAVLEAMKMETRVPATSSGAVNQVRVQTGDVVEAGQVLAVIG